MSVRKSDRSADYLQYCAAKYGTEKAPQGDWLRRCVPIIKLPVVLEQPNKECVRLFKPLPPATTYRRDGKIMVQDWQM